MGKTHRREKTFNEDFFYGSGRPRSSRKKKKGEKRFNETPSDNEHVEDDGYDSFEKFGKNR